ncbi:MAG TPA: hypothetical protein VD758_02615 [Gemmatimonadaceae bacterium]|jgi:hypothetical protein|nr:hypothetical protein [Gemmatimonadaceae bacterium]
MPRALTIQRTTVPASERAKYFEKVKACRSHYAAANCRFYVFEEASLPGAFIEFTEADDQTTLTVAHANSPYRILDPARIYNETEIA